MPECVANWFALRVHPHHEKAAEMQLKCASIEAYVPMCHARRRWSDRIKILEVPLFGGYVFSRFEPHERTKVLGMPSVTSIVGFAGTPVPLEDREIAALKTIAGAGMPVAPWPLLRVGQRIRIREGILAGVEGILVSEKSKFRLVVNIELLNRAVGVEIDRELVAPAEIPPLRPELAGVFTR